MRGAPSLCRDIFTSSGASGATLTAWPWCWRARQRDTAGTAAAGHRGMPCAAADAAMGSRPKDAAKSCRPATASPQVEPWPLTAAHSGRSFPLNCSCPLSLLHGLGRQARRAEGAPLMPSLIVADVSSHLDTFTPPEADALVFTSPRGTPMRHANFRRRVWLPALAAVGLSIHLHDLRHAGNQLVAEAGANPRELMERMGHSTSRAALIYLHSTSARQHHLADAVTARAQAELGTTEKPSGGSVARMWHDRKAPMTTPRDWLASRALNRTFKCAPTATRTRDLLLRRQSLYPLSYRGLPSS
jgi:hypothetical protein